MRRFSRNELMVVKAGMNRLAQECPKRMYCEIPISLNVDIGTDKGGVVTYISNVMGDLGLQGYEVHYEWADGLHAPGELSGHTMTFRLDNDGSFWSRDFWFKYTKKDRKRVCDFYMKLMARLYETSVRSLLDYCGLKRKKKHGKATRLDKGRNKGQTT